jgi:hypothetical protein
MAKADNILYLAGTTESLKVSERILISPPVTFGLNLRNLSYSCSDITKFFLSIEYFLLAIQFFWRDLLSITLPLKGPALETASINTLFSIGSDTVIQALACTYEILTFSTPSVADRDFFIASGQSLHVMPSISMTICWSALTLAEGINAIKTDTAITIICFMFTLSLLIKMNQHALKRCRKNESHGANPKDTTGDFPCSKILLTTAILFF